MPPKSAIQYVYEKYQINGKTYRIPANCTPGSRRFKFWQQWQDRGLPLPICEPKVEISESGVKPYLPFADYEKRLAAA